MLPRLPLFLALLLFPLGALASVVLSMTMEEMSSRAPLVVRGIVHRVDVQFAENRSKIWTYSEIVVAETLKGPSRTTVLVKQPGGDVGDIHERVSGVAHFAPGEDVVVFLEPCTDEPNCFVPMSLTASKVSLVQKGERRVALRDLFGVSFAKPGQKGVLAPVVRLENLGFEDAFLDRIRRAVKGGAR